MADLVDLCGRELFARRKLAGFVTQIGEADEFVGSEKVTDTIGEMLRDIRRVIGKSLGGVARLPAARQGLRQIPVEERDVWLNIV